MWSLTTPPKILIRLEDLRYFDIDVKASKKSFNEDRVICYMRACVNTKFLAFPQLTLLLTLTQPAFTLSKLTIETLRQGVKYVRS